MARVKACWDACVIITIVAGGDPDRTQDELAALKDAVTAFDDGDLILVAPAILESEVLEQFTDESKAALMEDITKRSNFVLQAITTEVARLAGEIRSELRALGESLKTADAQYVATAIIHGCDELHTYDGRLLKLSDRPEVRGLKICAPAVEQGTLGI